jgi:hypothetical protein
MTVDFSRQPLDSLFACGCDFNIAFDIEDAALVGNHPSVLAI